MISFKELTRPPQELTRAPHELTRAPHELTRAPHELTRAPQELPKPPQELTRTSHSAALRCSVNKSELAWAIGLAAGWAKPFCSPEVFGKEV